MNNILLARAQAAARLHTALLTTGMLRRQPQDRDRDSRATSSSGRPALTLRKLFDAYEGSFEGAANLMASVTFRELKVERVKMVSEKSLSPSMQKNELSALNRFMKLHGVNDDSAVAPLMVSGFPEALAAFETSEARGGKAAKRSVDTYVSYMRGLAAACAEMVAGLFANMGFCDALKIAMDRHLAAHPGTTPRKLAALASMPFRTLQNWSTGLWSPRPLNENYLCVYRLEKLFGLEEGVLSSRILDRKNRRKAQPGKDAQADPLRHIARVHYRPKEMPPRLKEFFDIVFAYHTRPLAPVNALGKRLIRPKRWRWRQADDGSYPSDGVMHAFLDGMVGWLMLPETLEEALAFVLSHPPGGTAPVSEKIAPGLAPLFMGKGLSPDAISIGHLFDPDIVAQYLEWRQNRSDAAANVQFLSHISGFLQPRHGILTQKVELIADYLGLNAASGSRATAAEYKAMTASWHETCGDWRADLEGLATFYHQTGRIGRVKKSLAPILDHPSPMSIVGGLINNFERARPQERLTGTLRLALWHRDRLLLRMLASNPLRNKNYRTMTYRVNNTGNLNQDRDGLWHISFRPRDFKNEKGQAKTHYYVDVAEDLTNLITTYLRDARPILQAKGIPCDELFLTQYGSPFGSSDLTDLLKRLGNAFLPEMPGLDGFGSHAFRHIIATAWLRANPGEYLTVAQILHDTLDTVLKNYTHTSPKDGLNRYHVWLRDIIAPAA